MNCDYNNFYFRTSNIQPVALERQVKLTLGTAPITIILCRTQKITSLGNDSVCSFYVQQYCWSVMCLIFVFYLIFMLLYVYMCWFSIVRKYDCLVILSCVCVYVCLSVALVLVSLSHQMYVAPLFNLCSRAWIDSSKILEFGWKFYTDWFG